MMRFVAFITIATHLVSCTRTVPTGRHQLSEYVAAEESGLSRSRSANGVRTSVTLHPPELSALRELSEGTDLDPVQLKPLIQSYRQQLYFVVNLAVDQAEPSTDIMYAGVRDINAFRRQAYDLNFGWSEMALLRCGSRTYRPQLSTLENTYGLTKDRNIILVFTPTEPEDRDFYSSDTIELELTNDVFGTGTQSFKFHRADLDRVGSAFDRT
jgi:hypothetical protein